MVPLFAKEKLLTCDSKMCCLDISFIDHFEFSRKGFGQTRASSDFLRVITKDSIPDKVLLCELLTLVGKR